MLELTGAKDPKALENLVTSLNLRMDPVIRDLNYYKSSLSALIQVIITCMELICVHVCHGHAY